MTYPRVVRYLTPSALHHINSRSYYRVYKITQHYFHTPHFIFLRDHISVLPDHSRLINNRLFNFHRSAQTSQARTRAYNTANHQRPHDHNFATTFTQPQKCVVSGNSSFLAAAKIPHTSSTTSTRAATISTTPSRTRAHHRHLGRCFMVARR